MDGTALPLIHFAGRLTYKIAHTDAWHNGVSLWPSMREAAPPVVRVLLSSTQTGRCAPLKSAEP